MLILGLPIEALDGAAAWELMLVLESKGWHWSTMPHRRRLDFVPSGPQTWCTGGLTDINTCRERSQHWYLQALACADVMLDRGVTSIAHGQYQSYCKRWLTGEDVEARPAAFS